MTVVQVSLLLWVCATNVGCKSEEEREREEVAETALAFMNHMGSARSAEAAKLATPEDRAAAETEERTSTWLYRHMKKALPPEPNCEVEKVIVDEATGSAKVDLVAASPGRFEYTIDLVRIAGQWKVDTKWAEAAAKEKAEKEERERKAKSKRLVQKAVGIQDRLGDYETAKAVLENALELDPENTAAKRELEIVESTLDARIVGDWIGDDREQVAFIRLRSDLPDGEYLGEPHAASLSLKCDKRSLELGASVWFEGLNVEDDDGDGRAPISMSVGESEEEFSAKIYRNEGTELTFEQPQELLELLGRGDELRMDVPFRAYREPQAWTFPIEGAPEVVELIRNECATSN